MKCPDCKPTPADASIPAASPAPVLEARKVSFSYGRGKAVLDGVSAALVPGTFLAVLGTNGSGKSTFLNCLDAVLSPTRGTVLLDGRDLGGVSRAQRARRIAYVAQHTHANRTTVYDALLLGRKPVMSGAPTQEDYAAVDEAIVRMGLGDIALRYLDELSGGEYQKTVIARAFVQDTDVLLLDEPTNNLDIANQHEVMRLVRRAVDGGAGIRTGTAGAAGAPSAPDPAVPAAAPRRIAAAAVMHDINLALAYCDAFVALAAGRVVASGSADIVTPQLLEEVYGIRADIIEHDGRRIVVVKGGYNA